MADPHCPNCQEEMGQPVTLHPLIIGHDGEFGLWGWHCIRCSSSYREDGEEGVGAEV